MSLTAPAFPTEQERSGFCKSSTGSVIACGKEVSSVLMIPRTICSTGLNLTCIHVSSSYWWKYVCYKVLHEIGVAPLSWSRLYIAVQRLQVHWCDLDRRNIKCTVNACRDSCPKLLLCESFGQLTAGLTSALLGSKTACKVMKVPDNYSEAWALVGYEYPDYEAGSGCTLKWPVLT